MSGIIFGGGLHLQAIAVKPLFHSSCWLALPQSTYMYIHTYIRVSARGAIARRRAMHCGNHSPSAGSFLRGVFRRLATFSGGIGSSVATVAPFLCVPVMYVHVLSPSPSHPPGIASPAHGRHPTLSTPPHSYLLTSTPLPRMMDTRTVTPLVTMYCTQSGSIYD